VGPVQFLIDCASIALVDGWENNNDTTTQHQ
jgi:hypothetical protein